MTVKLLDIPARIYLFKVNNGNTRIMCGTCSKLALNIFNKKRTNEIIYARSKRQEKSLSKFISKKLARAKSFENTETLCQNFYIRSAKECLR